MITRLSVVDCVRYCKSMKDGKCAVKRIAQGLRGFSYTEVCSPHGTDEGVVIPMGY